MVDGCVARIAGGATRGGELTDWNLAKVGSYSQEHRLDGIRWAYADTEGVLPARLVVFSVRAQGAARFGDAHFDWPPKR